MSIFEKQMRAIRKIAVLLYSKDPEHFKIVITEIDLKLAEMEELDLDSLDFSEDFDLQDIA
jgi:hypothetical protein